MDIISLIVGAIIGALSSWCIAHVYYVKSNKEQQKSFKEQQYLFNKLSEDVRLIILSDKRESLSIIELNELLAKKTITDFPKGDPLPYKACPKCGAKELKRGELISNDENYYIIQCQNCAWQDWTQ